jgi:hypothetical protein
MRAKAVAVALVLMSWVAAAPSAVAETPLVRLIDRTRPYDSLVQVHPRTLRTSSRPIRTFVDGWSSAFSPDGRFLAYSSSSRARVQLIDLVRWRSVRVLRFGRGGPGQLVWPRPDRLMQIRREDVLVLKVPSGRIIARHSFPAFSVDNEPIPNGVALLTQRRGRIGPAVLVLADADGGMRRIVLDGIAAGGNPRVWLKPALAVDPTGGRAFVVAARAPDIAEVDLATGTVSYHALGAQASKGGVEERWREATWLGGDRLAVSGDTHPRAPRDGRPAPGPVPYGLRVIDTSAWSARTLDRRVSELDLSGERLFGTGTTWSRGFRTSTSTGLLAYDLAGRAAYTRFRGKDVTVVGHHGRFTYAWLRPDRVLNVIETASGRTVHTRRTPPGWVPYLLSPP